MSIVHQEVLTVRETATYLRVSESIVRRSIKEKQIPHHRIYRKILFYKPELQKFMTKITVQPQDLSAEKEKAKEDANRIWNSRR